VKEQKLPHGHSVMGFESFEELQEYMAKAEREAIGNALPKQWEITWGSFVLRVVDSLVIWGYIFTEQEFMELEIGDEMADPKVVEEVLAIMEAQRDSQARGYRYGKYWSTILPDGELGSAHVSTLWEITEEDFNHARDHGWELDPALGTRIAHEIIDNTPLKEDES